MTNIELDTMHFIQMIPKRIDEATEQLKRIADVLEKMEAKDGPTIGQIVKEALEKGKKENDNEPVLQ